jgi:hypothetical protein
MSLTFLIPLGIGLITVYFSQQAIDDLAELINFTSVISLILSVILAPWELKFLLFVLLIVSTNRQ